MSESSGNPKDSTQRLEWHQAVRKRPGMYIGQINTRGFVEALKGIISRIIAECHTTLLNLEFDKDLGVKISYDNKGDFIENNWSVIRTRSNPFSIEYCVVNALSKRFTMKFRNDENELISEQLFERIENDKEATEKLIRKFKI